jgi:hypothetical protein
MRTLLLLLGLMLLPVASRAEPCDTSAVIQTAVLDAGRPYFVPTHPRVTTTIRFPKGIGAPDGAVTVFTEDAAHQPGEYLITWQQGDAYFTILPLKVAPMANLNVPFQGQTYVFYLYQVADQLRATASVNLVSQTAPTLTRPANTPGAATTGASANPPAEVARLPAPPETPYVAATPARLVGFLDRLKLIHGTAFGPELGALSEAMGVQIAVAPEERRPTSSSVAGIAELASGLNDAGLYQIVLLRAVRDRRLNCLGFICLIRNTSKEVLAFDVNSFGARVGAEYLGQRISDATAILKPGEQAPAYFVVQPDRNTPLQAANAWRLSVELVSPRLNPGAGIARAFTHREAQP